MRKSTMFLFGIFLLVAVPLTASADFMTYDQATMATFVYKSETYTAFNANDTGIGSFLQSSLIGHSNPDHDDGIPMDGSYGWIGNWVNAYADGFAEVFIGVSNSTSWSGITEVVQTFYNDNDDIWSAGLWVETSSGFYKSSVNVNPHDPLFPVPGENKVTITLDLFNLGADVDNILGYGIVVDAKFGTGLQPSPQDQFHMSSTPVPEPATMLLFGMGLAGIAGISARRQKK